MRWKVVAIGLVAAILVGGGATLALLRLSGGAGSGNRATATISAAPSAPATSTAESVPTPATSPITTPSPSPSAAVSNACAASRLNMVIGAAAFAAGGQEGVTALIGNDGVAACDLSGTLQVRLRSAGGSPLTTSQGTDAAGQAWLVPDRVALDAWDPQPGEATVLVSWHTGDRAPGVCSGSASAVGELSLTVPGGGEVVAPVNPSPSLPDGMAPCQGAVQLGAITPVASAATFTTDAQDAADAAIEDEEAVTVTTSCTPSAGQSCLTPSGETLGTAAAYFEYQLYGTGGGAVCYAYVYRDSAGWHPLDVLCTQDLAPANGSTVSITVPGGGCADIHSEPGHVARVLSCVSSSAQVTYAVEQGPVYVAETDPTTRLPMGTIWWYMSGLDGWVAQDFVASTGG